MEFEEIIDEFETWLDETIETLRDDNEDENLNLNDIENFHIETFEHAFILRYGSKRGDFPRLANSNFTNKYYILQSGEIEGELVIGDLNAKIPFDIEQIAYKYLLEDMMEGCKKGYVNEVNLSDGNKFKITVEKL